MKKYRSLLVVFLVHTAIIFIPIYQTAALDNGLALTPPMGWNSWNIFHENINETQIKQIADAMVSSGMRDAGYIYLNLDDNWMPETGNLWRASEDIIDTWDNGYSWGKGIIECIDDNRSLASYAGPGGWTEAIAVNQDPAGIQGTRISASNGLEVWCKPLGIASGITKAVALLNRNGSSASITVDFSNIGLSGTVTVRDLWVKADRGSFTGEVDEFFVYNRAISASEVAALGSTPEPTATPPAGTLGDVNGNGSIDIVDALLIAQYYVNLISEFC